MIQGSQVNVLNAAVETFETAPVEFQSMSLNGEVHMSIEACTTIKVTGELKALHWKKLCDRII